MRLDKEALRLLLQAVEGGEGREERRVKIKTKERCPKCKNKFSETPLGFLCLKCKTIPRRFYIYLSWKGRKIKIYSFRDGQPLSSWELARRAQELIAHEIESGIFDPSKWVKADLKEYLFSVRLRDYLERKRADLKPSAWKAKRLQLERALRIIGDLDVREIRASHIEKFRQELISQGVSPKTVKNALTELHAFLNDLARLEYIEKAPRFPSVKVPEPVIRYLDPEALRLILENIPEAHHDIFVFMFTYGTRPGEARALMWDCVDFREETILIRRTFSDYKVVDIPKEGDWKTLPMVEPIKEMLLRRYREKHTFFVFEHKPRFNPWRHYGDIFLRQIYLEACQKAGIENPPTLYQAVRHSFAMDMLNSGYSYEAVARALGHKHLTTTKRYGKLKTEAVRPMIDDRVAKIIDLSSYREKRRQTDSE